MTERKPPGVGFESWVDRQIREAMERGEFDNLPGAGKPIPDLDKTNDELWWLKRKLRDEGIPTEAMLPAALKLRKEIEQLPRTVRGLRSERAVREVVDALNRRIMDHLRAPSGPPVILVPVPVDDVVARWQADRPAPAAPPEPTGPQRIRWWHRITGRRRR